MEKLSFEEMRSNAKKRVELDDFLDEKYLFKTAFGIYLIFFSILYLFTPKDFAIPTAFLISILILLYAYYGDTKVKSIPHKISKVIISLIVIFLLSIFITFIMEYLIPNSIDFTFALLVFLSILFGLIYNIVNLYKALPYINPFSKASNISLKLIIFSGCSFIFIIYLFYNFSSVIISFDILRTAEENIIAKIGTSATVLSVGATMLNNINKQLTEKYFLEQVLFHKRFKSAFGK